MISLGPLSKKKYCTYSCTFCYVQSEFQKYVSLSIDEICTYLRENIDLFNIIYISGDTDSFARPRTKDGLFLLKTLSELFDKDILFTTRYVFTDSEAAEIIHINELLKQKGRTLFACVSLSCPIDNHNIEPPPIPSIIDRIELIKLLKKNDITTVLALRPLLPVFSLDNYVSIIEKTRHHVDAVLGERWYFDKNGVILKQVMGDDIIRSGKCDDMEMDFDDNGKVWTVWYDEDIEAELKNFCDIVGLPFFMRSQPAVEYLLKANRQR